MGPFLFFLTEYGNSGFKPEYIPYMTNQLQSEIKRLQRRMTFLKNELELKRSKTAREIAIIKKQIERLENRLDRISLKQD